MNAVGEPETGPCTWLCLFLRGLIIPNFRKKPGHLFRDQIPTLQESTLWILGSSWRQGRLTRQVGDGLTNIYQSNMYTHVLFINMKLAIVSKGPPFP